MSGSQSSKAIGYLGARSPVLAYGGDGRGARIHTENEYQEAARVPKSTQ